MADVERLALGEARDDVDEDEVIDAQGGYLEGGLSAHASGSSESNQCYRGEGRLAADKSQTGTVKTDVEGACRSEPKAERLGEVLELAVGRRGR